jgi:hypothetical protein
VQDNRQLILTAETLADERYMAFLRSQNANRTNILLVQNPLHRDATGRTKLDIAEVRKLYLDFDDDGRKRVSDLYASRKVPRAHETVQTSPGHYQLTWRVKDFSPEQAETAMKGLAKEFGADTAATDVNRTFRVPGFTNRKYDPAPLVTVQAYQGPEYSSGQFPHYTQEQVHAPVPVQYRDLAAGTGGKNSRSEQDWANTNRELAAGADPGELVRRLAQERRDKPNPLDYAQRTVENAQRAQERKRMEYRR